MCVFTIILITMPSLQITILMPISIVKIPISLLISILSHINFILTIKIIQVFMVTNNQPLIQPATDPLFEGFGLRKSLRRSRSGALRLRRLVLALGTAAGGRCALAMLGDFCQQQWWFYWTSWWFNGENGDLMWFNGVEWWKWRFDVGLLGCKGSLWSWFRWRSWHKYITSKTILF